MTNHGKSSGLKNVSVCHMHTEGVAAYTEPECVGKYRGFLCVETALRRADDSAAFPDSAKRSPFSTLVAPL
jgi:hypothetical protein